MLAALRVTASLIFCLRLATASGGQTAIQFVPVLNASEICGEGCVKFSISHMQAYAEHFNRLTKISLLQHELHPPSWQEFVRSGGRHELYSVNGSGRRHRAPVAALKITSDRYYDAKWREFDITKLVNRLHNHVLLGTKPRDHPIYVRGFTRRRLNADSEPSLSPMRDVSMALIKIRYTAPPEPPAREKRAVVNAAVTTACSGSETRQSCCVATKNIDLNNLDSTVTSLFVGPRNFELKYCAGACADQTAYQSKLLNTEPTKSCCHPYQYDNFVADVIKEDGSVDRGQIVQGFSVKSCICS